MTQSIQYFQTLLHTAMSLYFVQETEFSSLKKVPLPEKDLMSELLEKELTWEERAVLLLAIMPHVSPQSLDLFFIQNKQLDRPYTEFGGWKGTSHNGFLPTGETAAFLVAGNSDQKRKQFMKLFEPAHWFHKENILRLEGQGAGEPMLSGKLSPTEEFLARILNKGVYRPDYNAEFPARRMDTNLSWKDLVLPYNITEELGHISQWLANGQTIRDNWKLDKFIKPGYRCLFYGPPGTGKTLTASLLGKQQKMDVYRIDLSMIVSKFIGETEKNLAKIFDRAEHQNWILFFDEADALFGKRTDSGNSNDRHANQEVAYLLQRIEDFPGMIILATNLKDNLDEAFFRRFQSIIYFPVPNKPLRQKLWENMFPQEWLGEEKQDLLAEAADAVMSGGSMVNVLQSCAVQIFNSDEAVLSQEILRAAIKKELGKEGKLSN